MTYVETMHNSLTEDGIRIVCLCRRGQDHTEDKFDIPVEDDE